VSSEGKIAIAALISLAAWLYIVLPIIYLPGHWALQDWAYVASIISAVCFVLSLGVALFQINRARHVQNSSAASQLWDSYLGRALKYPAFAYPPNFAESFDFSAETFDKKKEEFERYEWFVSAFLHTSDEVLMEFDASDHRAKIVYRNANYHKAYLKWRRGKQIQGDYVDSLSPRLNALVRRVVES
jgi:hypothetical protein